jgi:hypothetical protein
MRSTIDMPKPESHSLKQRKEFEEAVERARKETPSAAAVANAAAKRNTYLDAVAEELDNVGKTQTEKDIFAPMPTRQVKDWF